jgi:pyruvate dehydrogenase E2 component (dihydrolipoamide acetyltransferase)
MTDVVMPQMGESIVEGTLTKWLKKKGDRIERDEPLFEISTDKVDTEIPSPVAGVLGEVLVQEGATVAIGTIVGKIDDTGSGAAPVAPVEEVSKPAPPEPTPPAPAPVAAEAASAPVAAEDAPAPVAAEDAPAPRPPAAAPESPSGPLSPLVRKMAREYNIDLNQVKGTGGGGRISKQDIEAYMSAQGARTIQASQPQPPQPPAAPVEQVSQPAPTAPPLPRAEQPHTRIEPMSTMRQRIAEHMVLSKRTSAHVTTVHRVDMTKVARTRDRAKAEFQARHGFSLTYLSFVTRAAAEALRAFPIVNASIDGTNIIYHNDINIGIAVALDGGNGLIVPVIRNADEMNVTGLQRAIVDLSTRARSRQLKPDEVQAGTFTITNFGSFGSVFATPVINQPQVAILGVGTVEKVPVVIDDAIGIRSQCYLALTFDHRLVDGALGDQFTAKVKSVLENWSEEVL